LFALASAACPPYSRLLAGANQIWRGFEAQVQLGVAGR